MCPVLNEFSVMLEQCFFARLSDNVKHCWVTNWTSDLQIEKLQAILSDEEACKFNFASFEAIPLPLDPEVRIKGIIPESASLFKVSDILFF